MHKTSIKTLSLVLSLLLVITVLCSLSFSVWAETEAVTGDLSGDGLVTQEDVDILAAVLAGTQDADGSVNYDISGNRMVDSDDLIVLKNLVDPSQPALEDKLDDGETEDILSLVASTEGGAVQSLIVRGNSTKALEMNATGNMTVLFTESQDWSGKVTLEMDTLWLAGGRTVTVALLGADGETVLGKPGMVAAQENGWSRVYVPLTGVTARERAEVGGFIVSVAADAHVYLDNLSLAEAPESEITRTDLEAALVEVAWDYHLKGGKVQYDSTELTTRGDVGSEEPMSKAYGGTWRTNTFSTLEDATTDSTVFSVCSDYCWNVYYEALGYPVLGHRVNTVTRGLFMNSEYPQDMVVARWWDDGYEFDSRWTDFGNGDSVRTPAETLLEMITNYDTYLRPGDILVAHGNGGHQHAMLYVGGGKILHCGGGKFNLATGKDEVEENGAIHLATTQGSFLDGTEQGGYFQLKDAIADTNTNGAWFVIVRPLDVLTLDDDDQNAGNDKLDLGYVLDTGKLQTELANNALRPVPTTGFTITDATYSRLQFPGMDINRTVSVRNYGTVAKGGQLTYTITITNNSNNTNYKNAGGTTTAYSGLTVTETVPANTAYVSNVGGGTYANGKITWTVNVPAGSSATVSYTVTATGNVGDKIVCGGGMVANIPSNVLTTTIGGQKLTANSLEAFRNSTVEAGWNSNNGYKISANASQETGFAERVYNEIAGLDLQLPGIQELADAFFTQTKVYQPYGLHYFYNEPKTRHMYVLNDKDEMADAYKIYRDMLVEGYYGGVWVYSNDYNNEARIIDPRTKYLEAGDILVYMNLKGSVSGGTEMEDRDVTSWRVLVYLGNDTFASLESNGRMRKVTGDGTALAGLTYDMFLVLRPSQAYEDLNTQIDAYTATAPDLTDEDASYVYKVPVSDVLLNEQNAAKITALTADEGWTSMNLGFATQVYKKVGLDIGTDGINGATYATVVLNCFDASSSWLKAYEYDRREEPVVGREALHSMVLYYGGTCFNNPVALTSLSQLHVGDVVLMGYRDYSAYLCAVYQGEGNFLVATQQKEKVTSGKQVTNWFQKTIASDSELASWLTSAINSSVSNWRKYEGYVVLRPSRAYADINAMAIRDLSEGRLTEEEKQKLSALTVDNWLEDGRSYQMANFVSWAYKAAGVDATAEMAGKTANGGHSAIFKTVSGKLTPMTSSDSAYNATYGAMLVPGLYGGANVAEHPDKILTAADLRIGDIFASAKFLSAGSYLFWVGIYQGNGQFLLTEITSIDKEYTARVATEILGMDFSQDWMYYYVLRPDYTVERNIEDGALTAEELVTIGALTKDDLSVVQPGTTASRVYAAAGINVSHLFGTDTYSTILNKLLVDGTGQLNDSTSATYDANFHAMLVPGYYGGNAYKGSALGRAFIPEDFKVGDIFMAYAKSRCTHEANAFNVVCAVYIGDGQFLAMSRSAASCETCHIVYMDTVEGNEHPTNVSIWATVEELSATTGYKHFFVLRPERLAPDALQSIALDQTSWTAAEAGDTVTLSVTKNPAAAAPNATLTWVSSDDSIAKVEDGVVTAIRGGTVTITACIDGYSASCTVTVPARAITTGALIPEELAAISNLTSLTAGKNPGVVAKEIYDAAGVDISAVLKNQSFNDVYAAVTATTASNHTKILVPGYSGGSQLAESRSFVPNDFKVGDLFMGYAPNHCDDCTSANTLTAVYIGNGQFLVADKNTCATCGGCYIDDYADAANNAASIWGDVTALDSTFSKYVVLRPERLAADALQSISLNETELALEKNATATLTVTKNPVDAAANAAVTWVSSNENAVTVVDGKLTAVGVGTATITAYCDGNSASCTVTVSARNIASGALTAEEILAIQSLTSLTPNKNPGVVAKEIYDAIGVDISAVLKNQGFNDVKNAVFAETESNHTKLLMPGYYGGSDMTESRSFVPADFKVGDLFVAYSSKKCGHETPGNNTVTGVYIGGGKFLLANRNTACTTCQINYVDAYVSSESVDMLSNATSVWADVDTLNAGYTCYFVLRPERLAPDALQGITLSDDGMNVALNKTTTLTVTKTPATAAANATVTWVSSNEEVAKVDQNGNVTALSVGRTTVTAYCDGYSASCVVAVVGRDIADGPLTAEEMNAITAFWRDSATTVGPVMKDAYALAEIDLNPAIGSPSYGNIREALFASNGTLLETPTNANYGKMLIPGYYGGSRRFASEDTVGKIFTPDDFKIGDAFIAAWDSGCETSGQMWVYITGIYVGNGRFVVAETHTGSNCTDECKRVYYSDYNTENADKAVVWGDEEAMKVYRYYFVLRPERLAADALQSISLNTETVDLTTNETYQLSFTKTPTQAAPAAQVTWVSSNTDVATVADGKITAVGVGTATITAYCDGNSASCEVTVTARNITAGVLNDREKAAIEGYESQSAGWWWAFAEPAYEAAGITVDVFGEKNNFNTLYPKVINPTEETDYSKMLVPGYYGGYSKKTGRTFVPSDVKVGDIFCSTYGKTTCEHSKYQYVTAIYQGNGKFLVAHFANGCTGDCSTVYVDEYGKELTNGKTSIWSDTAAEMETFQYYFVLRPERLAVDAIQSVTLNKTELTLNYTEANSLPAANVETLTFTKVPAAAVDPERVTWTTSNPDVATVDKNGNITAVGAGTCTITVNCDGYTATCQVTVTRTADARGSLTATEQAAIQAFTGEGNTAFATFAKDAYTAAGIDINPVFAKYGFYDLARKNFDVDGKTYALLEDTTLTEEQAKFRKMLIFDYYGGSNISVGKTFTAESFEVGDLFFAVRKCPTTNVGGLYIAGVYQGDGNFLIYEHHPSGCGGTCRSVFTDEYGVTEDTVVWGTSAEMKTIQYYFVLRPSRLAMRHISDGELTAAEQAVIANYSREEAGGTLSQVAIDAYTQAGIVVDFAFEKASISTAREALLVDKTGALIEGDTVWHKMLVEGSNGGSANADSTKTFTQADFQIGDIFCAIGLCEHSKWPAVTAIYLGDGKFQVASHASCACLLSYVDDINAVDGTGLLESNGRVSIWAEDVEALNSVWKHYFVLRPSQLAQ